MFFKDTESAARPSAVAMQRQPDGTVNVRLADNVREEIRENESGEQQTMFVYDEAVFTMDADRRETEADILENFAAWWAFACEPPEEPPTVEERLSIVEDVLMELMGGE